MSNNYGLFINYEYCTGCHTCEVACKKALGLPEGQYGIVLCEDGPRKNVKGTWDLTYLPLPTHLCDFCAERVGEGRLPSCVHHCQSGVMVYDTLDNLAKLAAEHPRSVIYSSQE